MKKQWKRLAALSSAAVMAAGMLLYFPTDTLQNISWGITASAEETGTVTWTESDGLTWTLSADGTTMTISGSGKMKDYFFDSPAYGNSKIKKVVIENGVTSIGTSAFERCSSLTDISIPKSVTSIGNYAFSDCTSLTSITIPKSVASIRSGAFAYCNNLTVNLEEGSPLTSENLGVSESKIATYWNEGTLTWTLDADGTLTISGSGAMKDYDTDHSPAVQKKDSVKKVVIENGITSIGAYAFYDCSGLTSIEIPESVTSIGNGAFKNCSSLTGITIPESVTSIGDHAFYRCTGLTGITIPESVTSIGRSAFYDCTGLTSITIPSSVTSIGFGVFYNCSSLKEVLLENGSKLTSGQLDVNKSIRAPLKTL